MIHNGFSIFVQVSPSFFQNFMGVFVSEDSVPCIAKRLACGSWLAFFRAALFFSRVSLLGGSFCDRGQGAVVLVLWVLGSSERHSQCVLQILQGHRAGLALAGFSPLVAHTSYLSARAHVRLVCLLARAWRRLHSPSCLIDNN